MTMTYTYPDAYLAKFCTETMETRAVADICRHGHIQCLLDRALTVLRAYIVCLENQADAEDLFTAKLKSYRAEMQPTQAQAQAAADAATAAGTVRTEFGMFTIPMERA